MRNEHLLVDLHFEFTNLFGLQARRNLVQPLKGAGCEQVAFQHHLWANAGDDHSRLQRLRTRDRKRGSGGRFFEVGQHNAAGFGFCSAFWWTVGDAFWQRAFAVTGGCWQWLKRAARISTDA